jgi:D-amino peptidase
MPSPSVLSHTYNPRAVSDVRINGIRAGESGINALVAAAFGVPVVCITGDQYVGPEAAAFCPDIDAIVVKQSVSRGAAQSVHPDVARERIRAGVAAAVTAAPGRRPPQVAGTLETDWLTTDMAAQAAMVRGVTRGGERSTAIDIGDDPLAAYRAFVATIAITRTLATAAY